MDDPVFDDGRYDRHMKDIDDTERLLEQFYDEFDKRLRDADEGEDASFFDELCEVIYGEFNRSYDEELIALMDEVLKPVVKEQIIEAVAKKAAEIKLEESE